MQRTQTRLRLTLFFRADHELTSYRVCLTLRNDFVPRSSWLYLIYVMRFCVDIVDEGRSSYLEDNRTNSQKELSLRYRRVESLRLGVSKSWQPMRLIPSSLWCEIYYNELWIIGYASGKKRATSRYHGLTHESRILIQPVITAHRSSVFFFCQKLKKKKRKKKKKNCPD
jgi:hypothetical protein